MKPIIRESRMEDIEKCEPLLKEFCEEMMMDSVGFCHDYNKYMEAAKSLVGPATFIMERDGIIIGLCAGVVTPAFLGTGKVYQEVVWFVTKAERKYGLMFFDAVESFCKKNFIDKMVFASINSTVGAKVESFYLRKGFKLLEKQFIKEVF